MSTWCWTCRAPKEPDRKRLCVECRQASSLADKAHRLEYRRQNRAERQAYGARYYRANAEPIKAWQAEYRRLHPEKYVERASRDYVKHMLQGARQRAREKGIPFDLAPEDIFIPTHCPILGVRLETGIGRGGRLDNSPSLDRIEGHKGYMPDNIIVISWRANRIKCDATVAELRAVTEFYERLQTVRYRTVTSRDTRAVAQL